MYFLLFSDFHSTLPEIIPGWIKFWGKSWYKRTEKIAKSLTDKERLRELIEVIFEEVNVPRIIRENLLKPNPGVANLFIVKTIQPWVILAGAILGILLGLLQLIFRL